jgi:hypothetical protein
MVHTSTTVLTATLAQSVIDEKVSSAVLSQCRTIELEAAQLLVKSASDLLLDGLEQISAEVAAVLSSHCGMMLSLNGLVAIEPAVAGALAGYRGQLHLDGIEQLSADVARELALHDGGLSLSALLELSEAAAVFFAGSHSNLTLDGLQSLPVGVAVCLLDSGAQDHHATARLAASLEGYIGQDESTLLEAFASAINNRILSLSGLREIDPVLAATLAEHRGMLILNGLRTIDHDTAEVLSNFKGPLLALDGMTQIESHALLALQRIPGLLSTDALEAGRDVVPDNPSDSTPHRRGRFGWGENDTVEFGKPEAGC